MKRFLSFLLLLSLVFFNAQDLSKYREMMNKAEQNSSNARLLVNSSETQFKKTNQAIFLAYLAVGNFMLAKHSANPINKLSFFKKGKKFLNNAVNYEPKNLEIRFLRYVSQKETPSFLGYKDHLKEDENFLKKNYKNSKDAYLVKEISNYLN